MRAYLRVLGVSMLLGGMVVSTAGCLQKEVRHTLYLSPAGVVWSVVEKDVRSDEQPGLARDTEERDYLLAADAGRHAVAAALRGLGAASIETRWIRRERPYSVMTDASFTDVAAIATAILREAHLQGEASLTRQGCRSTFAIRVGTDDPPSSGKADGDDVLDALIEDVDRYRFVLTEGRFASADGFIIEGDGTVAAPDPKKTASNGTLTARLVWDDGSCAPTSVR